MNKAHVAGIALLLAAAAILGMVAATRTAGLGRAASATPAQARTGSSLSWRAHRLDRIEAALRRSLRSRPPKLPPVPAVQHAVAAAPAAVVSTPVRAASRVIYQRPPPIVVVRHHAHGDDHEEGAGDD